MEINKEILEEMNVLSCYDLESLQKGIKVHSNATESKIAATNRLFEKGLISQEDGGYLTDRGHTAVEHLQHLSGILNQES